MTQEQKCVPDWALELLSRQPDPIQRFIDALPEDMREYAIETREMRAAFVSNAQRALVASDPREAVQYANELARTAVETAYRWSCLVRMATRWNQLHCEPIVFVMKEPTS